MRVLAHIIRFFLVQIQWIAVALALIGGAAGGFTVGQATHVQATAAPTAVVQEPARLHHFTQGIKNNDAEAQCQDLADNSELTCDQLRKGSAEVAQAGIVTDSVTFLGVTTTPDGSIAAYSFHGHAADKQADIGLLIYTDKDGKVVKEE